MAVYDKQGNQLYAVYGLTGPLGKAYDIDGNEIFSVGTVDYSTYTRSNYCAVSLSPMQGFDIHNGVIFQMVANLNTINNKFTSINTVTSAIIASNVAIASNHGNSACFSAEYYDPADDYPLLYVTAETYATGENPLVCVNRVTPTSSVLIKSISFPLARTGYYANFALDSVNNIGYTVGYTERSYTSDMSGANKMRIAKWDMSSLTLNQDGTYTPAFVSSIERPFIYVTQGHQFFDGMLWIGSGGTNVHGYVYAINPTNGETLYTVDTDTTVELEGIAFISPYEMVFGLQGGTYKLVTFEH